MLTHEQATALMVVVRGKMTADERHQLGEYLQHYGKIEHEKNLTPTQKINRAYDRSFARDGWPCHCYEWCEDDDEGVPRRLKCRLRDKEGT